MARVLIASQPWGILRGPSASEALIVGLVGVTARLNTPVYAAAEGSDTLDEFVTDGEGRLPGYVEEGVYLLTVEGDEQRVEAAQPPSVESGSGTILPWEALHAYAAGAPMTQGGVTYTRNSAGTSRATFDGTEAALWTALPVAASGLTTGTTIGTVDVSTGTPVISFQSNWGVDSSGNPYYDTAGAAAGESAVLIAAVDGTLNLVQPTGVTP